MVTVRLKRSSGARSWWAFWNFIPALGREPSTEGFQQGKVVRQMFQEDPSDCRENDGLEKAGLGHLKTGTLMRKCLHRVTGDGSLMRVGGSGAGAKRLDLRES